MVKTIQHVYENAETYGIDKNRIVVQGFSGGSFMALGASRILAEKNMQHMIKILVLMTPMISNQAGRLSKDKLWSFEKNFVSYNTSAFKLLATDYD